MKEIYREVKQLGGNKSRNLRKLQSIESENFMIPDFMIVDDLNYDTDRVQDFIDRYGEDTKFAVRSDSIFEDREDNSGAGEFITELNVSNNYTEIVLAIEKVIQDASNKTGETISVIIQEMVEEPDYAGTIFGLDVRDNNPNYYMINYAAGLGNQIVDGDTGSIALLSRKGGDLSNNEITRILDKGVKEIEKLYDTDLLDFEFAIRDEQLYLLQVRPLTATGKLSSYHSQSLNRLIGDINRRINNTILGDMIDINPAELLQGKSHRLINSFFADIFPDGPLIKAREFLGYGKPIDRMFHTLFDSPYIELKNNLESFLPDALSYDQKQLFVSYYNELINSNPTLQDKLDTVEYPISIEKLELIVQSMEISNSDRDKIIAVFRDFFDDLDDNLEALYENYYNLEKEICMKYFTGSRGDISKIHENINEMTLSEVHSAIKELTYHFSQHARAAFYYRDQDFTIYDGSLYSNKLKQHNAEINLSKGFNFLERSIIKFTGSSPLDPSLSLNNHCIIFETARENLKYIFMILVTYLGEKIEYEVGGNIPNDKLLNCDFTTMLKFIEEDKMNSLCNHADRRTENNQQMRTVKKPMVLNRNNNFDVFELLKNGSYFSFGHAKLDGKVVYIEDVTGLTSEDLKLIIQDKIILLPTATPEIDGYLDTIGNNSKCVITKYGGPGAHIVLKIREYNEMHEKQIPIVIGVGDLFDELINRSNISVDFISETIKA